MTSSLEDSHGYRIATLFGSAQSNVCIVAPFIKLAALVPLLEAISPQVPVRCVTRWLPRDIASGVSDPNIFFALEERGNSTLSLVDNLHAKIYVADEICLVGSANITDTALGYASHSNVETLILSTVSDPDVAATLELVSQLERPATLAHLEAVNVLAESLKSLPAESSNPAGWFPRSRRPERAFAYYSDPPTGFLTNADRTLLADIATANIAPGLSEREFAYVVAQLLRSLSMIEDVVDSPVDVTLTFADARLNLEMMASEEYAPRELWIALVLWTSYFLRDKVIREEITEIAIRRASPLN